MRDVRLLELLEGQWNRASLVQMEALGFTRDDVNHRVSTGRLRAVHEGVFAGRPFLDDQRGRWMAATLTAPESYLSHASSAALHEVVYDAPERLLALAPPPRTSVVSA